jgi:hypothetical protein
VRGAVLLKDEGGTQNAEDRPFSVHRSPFRLQERQLIEEQYDAFLADYGPGDEGEAELEEGEKRLRVRKRFKAAAARRGLELVFRRTTGNVLRFRITPAVAAEVAAPPAREPEPPSIPQAPPKGRGGRRKGVVASAL